MEESVQPTNRSEVARLRQQIEAEHQSACWALSGLAEGNTQHCYITRRMNHIGICQKRLVTLIGEEAAVEVLLEVFEKSPEQQGETHE